MNLNELIISMMDALGLEAEQDLYMGEQEIYVVFTYADERPEGHADNRPTADTAYIQLQLITPKEFNYFKLKKEIRNALEHADFLVTSTRSFLGDVYKGTEKTRQTVFELEYTEGREAGGEE